MPKLPDRIEDLPDDDETGDEFITKMSVNLSEVLSTEITKILDEIDRNEEEFMKLSREKGYSPNKARAIAISMYVSSRIVMGGLECFQMLKKEGKIK